MNIENNTSSKFGLNHLFNVGLGIPITKQLGNVYDTLRLLFQKMKTSNNDPSNRILALTNKHITILSISLFVMDTILIVLSLMLKSHQYKVV
jgi:hypothetical protein